MKSLKWVLTSAVLSIATPALAATEGDKENPAVWIALGTVFMGSFTAIIGGLIAARAKKKKHSDGE